VFVVDTVCGEVPLTETVCPEMALPLQSLLSNTSNPTLPARLPPAAKSVSCLSTSASTIG